MKGITLATGFLRIFRVLVPVLLMLAMVALPTPSSAQVSIGISVGIAPPELPIYEQPPIPGYGYVWTPGYWAYGPDGYYWVPGTWVLPPTIGYLVDAALVGLEQWVLHLARRLLGAACRLLRRHQLRLRLFRLGIRGRLLGPRTALLQP